MKGITAKGKGGHGLVQLTAYYSFVENYKREGVERDKAREIHSGLSHKALEYVAKEFTFHTKRALAMFKS